MQQTAQFGDTVKIRQLCRDENNDPTQTITGTPILKVFGFSETAIETPTVDQVASEAGFYEAEITVDSPSGYSAAQSYDMKWTWVIGGTTHGDMSTLFVV